MSIEVINPGGGGSSVTLQTNGTPNSTQTLQNLAAGTNITLAEVTGTVTITAASGAGNFVQTLVDFGFASGPEGDSVTTTVTGQTWVTSSSIIFCSAAGKATADHDPDDVWAERIVAYATNLVVGTGFDIVATSANEGGRTWGKYYINSTGA